MLRHLRHASILATLVLLLELLVVQGLLLLFLSHVTAVSGRSGHAGGRGWHGRDIIRRRDIIGSIDTVLVSGGFRCIQARLYLVRQNIMNGWMQHTWMRFLPSAFVTNGWSLGVVKVYTRPVSETTRSRTWVPVRTESS